jgi:hypothetical protein
MAACSVTGSFFMGERERSEPGREDRERGNRGVVGFSRGSSRRPGRQAGGGHSVLGGADTQQLEEGDKMLFLQEAPWALKNSRRFPKLHIIGNIC